jgi:hypothetical protein
MAKGGTRIVNLTPLATCEPRQSRNSLRRSLPLLMFLLTVMPTAHAFGSDSTEVLSINPPALAFARYLASLERRNPFTESGPVVVEIDASLPGLDKGASLKAIRETGASERSAYRVLQIEGDAMVRQQVIARYLSAQAQAEALPLSSLLISPANYKFRYRGSIHISGNLLYVFQVSPRKKRIGLIQGQLWIDPVTGVAVHEAGHFVKTTSVLLRRIEVVRDTSLYDGFPCARVTQNVIDTRLPVGQAELTITERPLRMPHPAAAFEPSGAKR